MLPRTVIRTGEIVVPDPAGISAGRRAAGRAWGLEVLTMSCGECSSGPCAKWNAPTPRRRWCWPSCTTWPATRLGDVIYRRVVERGRGHLTAQWTLDLLQAMNSLELWRWPMVSGAMRWPGAHGEHVHLPGCGCQMHAILGFSSMRWNASLPPSVWFRLAISPLAAGAVRCAGDTGHDDFTRAAGRAGAWRSLIRQVRPWHASRAFAGPVGGPRLPQRDTHRRG